MEDGTLVRNVERLDTLTTGTGADALYVTTAQDGFHWYAGGSGLPGLSQDGLYFDATGDASPITTSTTTDANGGFDYTIVDGANGIENHADQLGYVSIIGGDANDVLFGSGTVGDGVGNDTLDGGAGADTMQGGWGNDVYYVDNPGDVIIEGVNGVDDGSFDTVISSISYTLSDPLIEGLTLIGHDNINATGNADDNQITGNAGNNVLSGLDGDDVLSDYAGQDTFLGGAGNDTIEAGTGADSIDGGTVTDYAHGTDSLWFNGADFGVAVGGTLSADMFTAGTSPSARMVNSSGMPRPTPCTGTMTVPAVMRRSPSPPSPASPSSTPQTSISNRVDTSNGAFKAGEGGALQMMWIMAAGGLP